MASTSASADSGNTDSANPAAPHSSVPAVEGFGALAELLTPDGMRLLDSLPEYSEAQSLSLGEKLRNEGHSPALVSEALTQSRLRVKAREKFGPFAERMLFTAHGLEQSTRLSIAAHHAARFRDAEIHTVADLGCGLGGDTIAKAGLGLTVIGVDADPRTVALATVNTSLFESVTIEHGTAEEFDLSRVQGAWFDPARRDGRGRVHDPEEAMPPLSVIVKAARTLGAQQTSATDSHGFGAVGAKLAPAIDHEHLVPGTETQWISWHGQVLEACAWFGPLTRRSAGEISGVVPRSALLIGSRADGTPHTTVLDPDTDDDDALRYPDVDELGSIIMEPDGAIIRAGLLGTVARRLGAHTIDPTIAYLSSSGNPETTAASPLVRAFRVDDVLPMHTKKIAAYMKQRSIGTLEIKKRGVDIDPARLRTQLKLDKKASNAATLIVTRVAGERVAIVATPL